jgi:hypothetical protein
MKKLPAGGRLGDTAEMLLALFLDDKFSSHHSSFVTVDMENL